VKDDWIENKREKRIYKEKNNRNQVFKVKIKYNLWYQYDKNKILVVVAVSICTEFLIW